MKAKLKALQDFVEDNIIVIATVLILTLVGFFTGKALADTLVLDSGATCPIHPMGNAGNYDQTYNPTGIDVTTCTHPGLEAFVDLLEKCNPAPIETYPDLPDCNALVVSPATGSYPCIDYGD
jgi:hypothetical protein